MRLKRPAPYLLTEIIISLRQCVMQLKFKLKQKISTLVSVTHNKALFQG